MMGGFRSWGGCLDTLIITYALGLSGTCARIRSRERGSPAATAAQDAHVPHREVDREVMGLGVSRVCAMM
eukprot:575080-Prymnesium_polylepis.1